MNPTNGHATPPVDLTPFYAEITHHTREAIVRGALLGMIDVLPPTQEQQTTDQLRGELARRMAALRPAPVTAQQPEPATEDAETPAGRKRGGK